MCHCLMRMILIWGCVVLLVIMDTVQVQLVGLLRKIGSCLPHSLGLISVLVGDRVVKIVKKA